MIFRWQQFGEIILCIEVGDSSLGLQINESYWNLMQFDLNDLEQTPFSPSFTPRRPNRAQKYEPDRPSSSLSCVLCIYGQY